MSVRAVFCPLVAVLPIVIGCGDSISIAPSCPNSLNVGETGQVFVLGADNNAVTLTAAGNGACDLLFLSGAPINEPIAAHGPFVMNTREEIIAAIEDYNSGRMGRL